MHHGILKVISGETMITPDDVRLYILVNIGAKLIKILDIMAIRLKI